jgi:hypothetical protein
MSDGSFVIFSDGTFTAQSGDKSISGSYIALQIGGNSYIQFRSEPDRDAVETETLFDGCYLASYPPSADDSSQIDEDRIILQPYTVQLNDSYPSSGHPVILTRDKDGSR